MPVYLRTSGYKVYFWSNEKDEPVHFHITKGNISQKDLTRIFNVMESYYLNFLDFWKSYFSTIKFYR